MALFKAEQILQIKEEDEVIDLDFFKIPPGKEYPTITIKMNESTREAARTAEQKYNTVMIRYGTDTPTGEVVVNPEKYCIKVLQQAYVSSEGLIDKPTKAVVIALVKREPIFAQRLSGKIMNLFKHADLYQRQQEEQDSRD